MKVTILTANLQNKLSFLNRAVSPKTQLPVLQNILIEAHDGKIWLESKDGLGSTFHVQLHKHLLSQTYPELEAAETV